MPTFGGSQSVQDSWDFDNHLNRRVVKITLTADPTFNEKVYCIISRPLQPDYLFFNYLDYQITIQDQYKDMGVSES